MRLGKFGERELLSDFRFLEEAALLGEAAGRTRRRLDKGAAHSAGALGFMLRQVWHLPALPEAHRPPLVMQRSRACRVNVSCCLCACAADTAEEHAVGHPARQRTEEAGQHELL